LCSDIYANLAAKANASETSRPALSLNPSAATGLSGTSLILYQAPHLPVWWMSHKVVMLSIHINMMPAILCHKGSDEPTQAFLWLAGDIDNHSLATTQPYDTCRWVNIRLSIDANERLNTEDWPLQGIHVELKDESDKDLVALGGLHTLVEMGTVEDRFQL
jgi:hypothetical protein